MLQLGGDFAVDRSGILVFTHRMKDNGDRVGINVLLQGLGKAVKKRANFRQVHLQAGNQVR